MIGFPLAEAGVPHVRSDVERMRPNYSLVAGSPRRRTASTETPVKSAEAAA